MHSPQAAVPVTIFLVLAGLNMPEDWSVKDSPASSRAQLSGKYHMGTSACGPVGIPYASYCSSEHSKALLSHFFYFN